MDVEIALAIWNALTANQKNQFCIARASYVE